MEANNDDLSEMSTEIRMFNIINLCKFEVISDLTGAWYLYFSEPFDTARPIALFVTISRSLGFGSSNFLLLDVSLVS